MMGAGAVIEWMWKKAGQHWAWILVFFVPLALFIVFKLVLQVFRPPVKVVDPVEKADARAKVERTARQEAAVAVQEELAAELEDIRVKKEAEALRGFQEAEKAFDKLRKDPDDLVEAMKRVGKGEKL